MDTISQAVMNRTTARHRRQVLIGAMILAALIGGYGLSLAGRNPSPAATPANTGGVVFGPEHSALNAPAAGIADQSGQLFVHGKVMAPNSAPRTRASKSSGLPSDIIKTANLTIRVGHKKAGHASAVATRVARRLGGYVSYRASYDHNADIELQVRIPSQNFEFALSQMRALGTVESESDNTQDVTLDVVDLGSRLKNLEAQRNELLSLFAKAKTVADTIRVQQVLGNIQGQVEQTQGRMRYLANQTTFATISLSFHTKAVKHHHHRVVSSTIGNAFGTAGNGIVNVVAGAIVVVGYALPLAGLMFLGYAAFALARRMYLWRKSQGTVSAVPAA